jgi:hypothetical protein
MLKFKLIYARQSVGQSVLVSGAHLGPVTNFSFSLKFPSGSCGFVILLRPLWREDGSVFYCKMLLGLARAVALRSKSCRTHGHILLSDLRLPQPGVPGPRIYIPQEQGDPVIPPGTGFFKPIIRLIDHKSVHGSELSGTYLTQLNNSSLSHCLTRHVKSTVTSASPQLQLVAGGADGGATCRHECELMLK